MPHDIKKRLIEIGDVIRTKPYNTDSNRYHVGPVVSMNDVNGPPTQTCTGQFSFLPEGKSTNSYLNDLVTDYFGADEALLILKANGDLPEGDDTNVEKLKNIISAIELHGCLTGDCPHDTKTECYMELIKIPNLILEMEKQSA